MDKDQPAEQNSTVEENVKESVDTVVEDMACDDAVDEVSDPNTSVDAQDAPNDPKPLMAAPTGAKRTSVFIPMVLGGLIAGGIGYGVATYMNMQQVSSIEVVQTEQDNLRSDISGVSDAVKALQSAPQVPDLSAEITMLKTSLVNAENTLGSLQTALVNTNNRLLSLEKRPLAEVVAPEAIAAYQAELDTLQSRVADQLAQIEHVANAATSEINAAKERAAELELKAAQNARFGAGVSALNTISSAMSAGGGYADPLATFMANNDAELPAVIIDNAENGVETLSNLQTAFPDLADAALAAARSAGVDGSGDTGVSAFFKAQLSIRSLEPQEGTSVDAILSRADAALKNGDLSAVMVEVASLPDQAKAQIADWQALVQTRLDAIAAVTQLSNALSAN